MFLGPGCLHLAELGRSICDLIEAVRGRWLKRAALPILKAILARVLTDLRIKHAVLLVE